MKKMDLPVFCSHTKMMKISELEKIVHPRNPNAHPYDQVNMLSKILQKNGWRAPITVSNRCGLIIRGHGRLLAAKKAGCKNAPVDFQDYETEKDEMADMVADNRIQQQSILDLEECLKIIDDFNIGDLDCEQFGFLLDDYENYINIPSLSNFNSDSLPDNKNTETFEDKTNISENTEKNIYMVCPQCGYEIKKGA